MTGHIIIDWLFSRFVWIKRNKIFYGVSANHKRNVAYDWSHGDGDGDGDGNGDSDDSDDDDEDDDLPNTSQI